MKVNPITIEVTLDELNAIRHRPTTVYLCPKCGRPVDSITVLNIESGKQSVEDPYCQFCEGKKEAWEKANEKIEAIEKKFNFINHPHTWTVEREKNICIKCGIFKDYFNKLG